MVRKEAKDNGMVEETGAPRAMIAPMPLRAAPSEEAKDNGTVEETGAPRAMVAPTPLRPMPRLRGEGPICPKCGSGMVSNGRHRAGNHPFRQITHWTCKQPKCTFTTKTVVG